MVLSTRKQYSLDKNIKMKLSIINDFKINDRIDLTFFREEFKNLTIVWKIILLHIIKPNINMKDIKKLDEAFFCIRSILENKSSIKLT